MSPVTQEQAWQPHGLGTPERLSQEGGCVVRLPASFPQSFSIFGCTELLQLQGAPRINVGFGSVGEPLYLLGT